MKYKTTLRAPFSAGLIASLLTTISLHGQTDGTWDGGGGSGIWGGFNNWDPNGVIATGVGATATFASAFGNGRTVLLNGNRNLGHIVYTDPEDETAMAISWFTNQAAVTLTLNAGVDTPSIDVTQPDRTLTITARLGGTNGLTKIGPGTLVIGPPGSAPNHQISGVTTLQQGTLVLADGLGLARCVFDTANSIAGDAENGLGTDAAELTFAGLAGDKDFASMFTTTSGGYDEVTSLTLNSIASTAAIYSGAIADGATGMTLTKSGPGSQMLLGANSYTGATFVDAGSLVLSTAGSATSGITVADNAAFGVAVATSDGQLAIAGDLAMGDGASLTIDFGGSNPGTTSPPLAVTHFTVGNTPSLKIALDSLPALLAGQSYPLVSWSGSGPSDASAFALDLPNFRMSGDLSVTGNTLFLNITANTAGPLSWNIGDGIWDTIATNWLDVTLAPTAYVDPFDDVLFGDASGAAGNPVVTLNAGFTPASVMMNTTGRGYTITGGGGIDGSGPITLDAANQGTLTIGTQNLYDGTITVEGGTLALDGAGSLGAGANLNLNGGRFELGGLTSTMAAATITQPSVSGDTIANGTLSVSSFAVSNPSGEVVISADLTGPGGIFMSGEGSLSLFGDNSYSGATTISQGTLKLGAGEVIPDGAATGNVTVNGLLDLNGFSETVNGLNGSGTVDTLAGGTPTLTVGGNNVSGNFSGVLQNTDGTLNLAKIGTGAQVLSGGNPLNGSVTVDGGTLALGHVNALPNIAGISLADGTTLRADVVNATVSAPVTLGGVDTTATINAPTVAGAGGTTPVPFALNGAIGGEGNVIFIGTQATNAYGTIILNAASTYTGDTLVTCSGSPNTQIAVFLGIDNALPTGTVLTLDGGNGTGSAPGRRATLDLKGFNQTLAGLTNVPRTLRVQQVFNTGPNAATFSIHNSEDFTYSGVIGGNPGNGNIGIAKSGPGRQALTGPLGYSGDTTVSEGILVLGRLNPENDDSTVAIAATAAALELAFDGTETVASLVIGGVAQDPGIYGAVDSAEPVIGIPQITGAGTLSVTGMEPGGYATWAAMNVGGQAPDEDFDGDGVPNGVEFFLNAAPGFTVLPVLDASSSITWTNGGNIPAADYGTQFAVQTSSDLSEWTDVPVGELSSNTDGPDGSITYTLSGPAPRFIRLKVTPAP